MIVLRKSIKADYCPCFTGYKVVVDISYSVRFYKVEPEKITLQPVNMDSLQLQAPTFYTFLYFQAYTYTPMHILLNTRRKAVNSTQWHSTVSLHQRQPVYSKKNKLQENFKSCTHFGE